MVIGLQPLEFSDCITDSPYFRQKLHDHERELQKTNQQIKRLIKELKDLLNAAKNLSRAQRLVSSSLQQFDFECIGTTQTDDELVITRSLAEFGRLISSIEDERDRMLARAYDQFIIPLENFRKEHIGGVKDGKKKFEKQTTKFCQSQERYLNLSTKKQDSVLQEADATLEMEQRHFCQASLEYVFLLQEVQERKKFEFVETMLGFMFSWLTFYHQGHEVNEDFKPYMRELQFRIQKTRDNFNETRDKTESLMRKMLEMRQSKSLETNSNNQKVTREGYLFLLERKLPGFKNTGQATKWLQNKSLGDALSTTTWTKHYCIYRRETKEFEMITFNQMIGKFNTSEKMIISSCIRRMSDSIDKRFCFDLTSDDRPGIIYTFQALSEEDRKLWMDVMDGKEPEYGVPSVPTLNSSDNNIFLDDAGFNFINKCIQTVESRGLDEQGLYRVGGVSSKITKLLAMGLDRRKTTNGLNSLNFLDDSIEWETKTITSALKLFLRNLPEPLMTFKYHNAFISAAKHELRLKRINDVHILLHKIPKQNFNMLELLVKHLCNVVTHSEQNLMTVSNIAVCFGPTLMRPERETVAAIMDIKFCNVVVEILIENYAKIFKTEPDLDIEYEPTSGHQQSSSSQKLKYSPVTPTVTHAIIKSYNDGPLISTNLHNVGATPTIPSHSIPIANLNRLSLTSSTSSALSEANLHNLNVYSKPVTHAASPNKNYYYSVDSQNPVNSSSSSSNESVCSVFSLDNPQMQPSRAPQKTKRSIKMGVHYAMSYRPQDTVRVRTLYACLGENDGELSFEPNQIITNVRSSCEPGWLEGTLNGKTGLVPENYVELLP
ncbi:Arfaptin homology (AH) domain/BAR domain,PH domain-like,Pleckstrin homology domain,SH3 domain,Rho [Cinara cedri]|uniref:Arfaptin homology (AH) domain/BAR domain,PH domain-like,Pleckstrin homology domain,SH3 domain,Rho n=1 Tax=Cinara cedri TaxID=506608 RepID=A0A5E4NFP6_9HEMI|nr:Arfaptin homology (AH) domain/BAR domain,PH domain-like,Pleckstrin homology domain,SH3 domain,Rho [Cinara cedri]